MDWLRDAWDAHGNTNLPDAKRRVDSFLRKLQTSTQIGQRSFGVRRIFEVEQSAHATSQQMLRTGADYARHLFPKVSFLGPNANPGVLFGQGRKERKRAEAEYDRLSPAAAMDRAQAFLSDRRASEGRSPYKMAGGEYEVDEAALDQASRFGLFDIGVDLKTTNDPSQAEIDAVKAKVKAGLSWDDALGNRVVHKQDLSDAGAVLLIEQARYSRWMAGQRLEHELQAINLDRTRTLESGADALGATGKDRAKVVGALGRLAEWRAKDRLMGLGPNGQHRPPKNVKGDAKKAADRAFDRVLLNLRGRSEEAGAAQVIKDLKLDALKGLDQKEVRKVVAQLLRQEVHARKEAQLAHQTLASSYIHFARRGRQAVVVEARVQNADGSWSKVRLNKDWKAVMPFLAEENRARAEQTARETNAILEKMAPATVLDQFEVERKVTFHAKVYSRGDDERVTMSGNANPDALLTMLDNAGAEVDVDTREMLVDLYGRGGALHGALLRRHGNPGQDKNAARSVAEWGKAQAYSAAQARVEREVPRILADTKLWRGNTREMAELSARVKAAWQAAVAREAAGGPPAKADALWHQARDAADRYARQMRYSFDGQFRDASGATVQGQGRAEEYRSHAIRTYNQSVDKRGTGFEGIIPEGYASTGITAVALMQLGGSPATAGLNLLAPWMTGLPYLASYNGKRGWGAGHGFAESAAELSLAFKVLAHRHWNDPQYIDSKDGRAEAARLGIEEPLLNMLRDEIGAGRLQAAEAVAVLGQAAGRATGGLTARTGIDAYMSMFNYTEQYSRRAMFLAAARLEAKRWIASGEQLSNPDVLKAVKAAAEAAVDETLGNYAHHNRSTLSRHPILMYPMMYKHFVVTTLQAFHNMNWPARIMFLGSVMMLGGMKELPYAQDLADLFETLLRVGGYKGRTIEHAVSRMFDEILPGSGKMFINGLANSALGATLSTRTGFGNVVPGTSVGIPGASTAREMEEVAGAFYSGAVGSLKLAGELGHQALEAVGAVPETRTWRALAHDMPATLVRNLMHGAMILHDGKVIDRRGNVIEPQAPAHWALYRAVGFSPWKTTHERNLVHWRRVMDADQKSNRSAFVRAAVEARVRGDAAKERAIAAAVDDHNRAVNRGKMPEVYLIRNFHRSVNQAYKHSKLGIIDRATQVGRKGDRDFWAEEWGLEVF